MSKPKDYSSQSYSPRSNAPTKNYPSTRVDPSGKSREKDDMVGLNDKFVRLIEKVKHLEDDNKKLDTKLKIIKEQEIYEGKIDDIVNQLENEMEEQIDNLIRDQEKLKSELRKNQGEVEDTKKNYEDELQKRSDLENEFVVLKKEVDEGHLEAVDLVLEAEELMGQLDFLRVGYDEEVKELESLIQNETVILRDSNIQRSLDMEEIVESVKNQYASMAARSRDEVEHWNKKKMDTMVFGAGQREQDVRELKREISDTIRHIQRLNGDLEALKRKEGSLKKEISDTQVEGDNDLKKSRVSIIQLEEALKRAKKDLAGQVRDYQELMNLKLALDIEIATYRKLLEGEEQRMNDLMRHQDVKLLEKPKASEPTVSASTTIIPVKPPAPSFSSKKKLMLRVEVKSGRAISERSHYTEK